MKIGILGGSFDPIHLGHIEMANVSKKNFNLDKVLFVPTKISPFKLNGAHVSDANRIDMLKISLEEVNEPSFVLSLEDISREGVSYTYELLQRLSSHYPDDDLYFIIGADSLKGIGKWYKARDLIKKFNFIVLSRPEFNIQLPIDRLSIEESNKVTQNQVKDFIWNVSSTSIREAIKNDDWVYLKRYLTNDVIDYINANKLYKAN